LCMNKKIILLFIDGIGIGERNKYNPFFLVNSIYLSHFKDEFENNIKKCLVHNLIVFALDPLLDVEGIPQSATGQSSIFTGINTAKILNQHLMGFPNKKLRVMLMKNNLLLNLKKRGLKVKFINAYPLFAEELSKGWLEVDKEGNFVLKEKSENLKKFLKRVSVTTLLALSIKQKFYGLSDLINKRTIYHDFTNKFLIERGIDVPEFSPKTAANILIKNVSKYDVILYEYFLTDKIGHKPAMKKAIKIVQNLDLFLKNIVENLNLKKTSLIIFSDHGNFEDLSVKTHTKNYVPLIHIGKNLSPDFRIKKIHQIYRYISQL